MSKIVEDNEEKKEDIMTIGVDPVSYTHLDVYKRQPTHPAENEMRSGDIFVKFLPPNVTSLIQPLDQGSLEALKRRYLKALLSKIVEDNEEKKEDMTILKKINIKDVIYMSAAAWEDVSQKTLRNSWKKLWPEIAENCDAETTESAKNDNLSGNKEIIELLKDIEGCENVE